MRATEHYNEGISQRDRAWQLENKLESAREDKRAKLEKKIRMAPTAPRPSSSRPPSLSTPGTTGPWAVWATHAANWATSIRRCEPTTQALEIEPDYPEAIEYRAEAYLGLNRIDEAQNAYRVLSEQDATNWPRTC